MQFEGKYNTRCPAVKRLMREAQELHEPTEDYYVQPLEENLFEWHFTVRGPPGTEFEGGFYHGRIILPPEYPMKPPNIIILTPNGRFEINTKICLSISGHHPESWQPSWSIRTALLALIGFMPTSAHGSLGSLNYTPEERKILAKKSCEFNCDVCGMIKGHVLATSLNNTSVQDEAKQLAAQINFKGEGEKHLKEEECKSVTDVPNTTQQSEITPHSNSENNGMLRNRQRAQNAVEENIQNIDQENGGPNTSNIFICFIVIAIVLLLYRRVFVIPIEESLR